MFTLVVLIIIRGGFDTHSLELVKVEGFANEKLCKAAAKQFTGESWCLKLR